MVITRASQARDEGSIPFARFYPFAVMQRRAYLMRLKKERIADYVEVQPARVTAKENVAVGWNGTIVTSP